MPRASALRPLASSLRSDITFHAAARRTFSGVRCPLVAKSQPIVSSRLTRQSFRASQSRSYADQTNPEPKVVAKKSGFRALRWIWRLTYLSTLGGLGYIAYGIYESRTPAEQLEPDPSKKTLVVLGMQRLIAVVHACTDRPV